MIWFLALILFVLLITVGGERGASAVLALCGNIGVLALTVLLLASGKPPLLIIPVAAVLISYLTLMKQNGSNLKTKTAFLTVAVVMAVLSVGICVGVWKTGSAGLNEIQAVQEDVQFYYTTDLVISMQQVAEPYIRNRAVRHLQKNRVVIFGCGTGNPFFSTDTAASLRAAEIDAQIILKATMVDGIYDSDPHKNPNAKRYSTISFDQVLSEQLGVMDMTAASMCRDNHIPVLVFSLEDPDNILRAVKQEDVGTLVK